MIHATAYIMTSFTGTNVIDVLACKFHTASDECFGNEAISHTISQLQLGYIQMRKKISLGAVRCFKSQFHH